MKAYKSIKLISLVTLGALLFSFHLCACEDALAATQVDESSGHHDSNGRHSHDTNSEDKSSCCAKIVAVQNASKLSSPMENQTLSENNWKAGVPGTSISTDPPLIKYLQFEFPPGVSPPGIFLSSHFTHAPPVLS